MERLLDHAARNTGPNHRQVAAIRRLGKQTGRTRAIAAHQRTHHVTCQIARTDLLKLADPGLLRLTRTLTQGGAFHLTIAPDLALAPAPRAA